MLNFEAFLTFSIAFLLPALKIDCLSTRDNTILPQLFKKHVESHVDFTETESAHQYRIFLQDVEKDVPPDQIGVSFIGPNESGNMEYLNARVMHKDRWLRGWRAVDVVAHLQKPVKPHTIAQVARDRLYRKNPLEQKTIKIMGTQAHKHEEELLFSDNEGDWLLTVTIPLSQLAEDEYGSIPAIQSSNIQGASLAFFPKRMSLGIPFIIERKSVLEKPPIKYIPTFWQRLFRKR